jgi:hypothetical protein
LIPASAPRPTTFQNIQFFEEDSIEEHLDLDLNFVPDELRDDVSTAVEVQCDEEHEAQNHFEIMSELFGVAPSGSLKRWLESSKERQLTKRSRK